MVDQTVMVWDLETVPDLEAAGRVLDMVGAPVSEIRAGLGDGFPKHPLHKIVCIGALIASRQTEGWRIDALGASHLGERSEAELIGSFGDKIGELRPQLVTFNGNSFDLPVIRYRRWSTGSWRRGSRFAHTSTATPKMRFDLCDVLGSFTGQAKVKLDDLAKVLGLPGKPQGIDGSQVEAFVDRRQPPRSVGLRTAASWNLTWQQEKMIAA